MTVFSELTSEQIQDLIGRFDLSRAGKGERNDLDDPGAPDPILAAEWRAHHRRRQAGRHPDQPWFAVTQFRQGVSDG